MPRDPISELLGRLRQLNINERVRVFGSVMKQDPKAHDLDCVLDFDPEPFQGSVFAPSDLDTSKGLTGLPTSFQDIATSLLACRQDPGLQSLKGPLLNCFVRFEGRLLAPNQTSPWWLASPVAISIWQKALTRGVPLTKLAWPPAVSDLPKP